MGVGGVPDLEELDVEISARELDLNLPVERVLDDEVAVKKAVLRGRRGWKGQVITVAPGTKLLLDTCGVPAHSYSQKIQYLVKFFKAKKPLYYVPKGFAQNLNKLDEPIREEEFGEFGPGVGKRGSDVDKALED